MANRTLTQLIAGVRQLANVENNNFVTDTELTDVVNEAIIELYDLVISVYEHYYVRSFTFTLTGGFSGNSQSLAAITGGFYKDNTLEKNPGTTNMRLVKRLGAFTERDNGRLTYEIIDTPATLFVYPPEQSGATYRLLYTPEAPSLAAGSDALDATLNRFYQYIKIRGAIYVHRKRQKLEDAALLTGDESNPQPGTLAFEKRRVLTMAHNKQESPQQVPMPRRGGNSIFDTDDSN